MLFISTIQGLKGLDEISTNNQRVILIENLVPM